MSQLSSYSKFLNPPKFLEMQSVSIEVADQGVRFLVTERTKDGIVPVNFGFVEIDTSNTELLIKAISDIRKKTKLNYVRFSLSEDKTYIFKTHLPNLKAQEIREVLDFKLEENIPLSSKEAVFDYDILRNLRFKEGLDLVVSASPSKEIEAWQNIFKSAGLIPIIFSPESQNVAKSLVHPNNQQVLIIVNIKDKKTVFSLLSFGLVCQTSSVSIGSDNFKDLISRRGERESDVLSQIINPLSIIKEELGKFVSYCNTRVDIGGKVNRIILCGRDSKIDGLINYLSADSNLPIEVGNVWINNFDIKQFTPSISKEDSFDYASINGLSLL